MLTDSYRCHPAIINQSSFMFYDSKLKAHEDLKEKYHTLANWDLLPKKV